MMTASVLFSKTGPEIPPTNSGSTSPFSDTNEIKFYKHSIHFALSPVQNMTCNLAVQLHNWLFHNFGIPFSLRMGDHWSLTDDKVFFNR